MSTIEITEATGAWWSAPLAVLILIAFCAVTWAVVHPRLTWAYLSLVWHRGRDYRRRQRAARHRRSTLTHLAFRKAASR